MKLSNAEIQKFLDTIGVKNSQNDHSLAFLNQIILNAGQYMPWQNISMIENGLGHIPVFEEIKNNMLSGKGGICMEVNRFMFYFLNKVGYKIQYILCGRKNQEKKHIALVVSIDDTKYFVDFGDAQPYFEAIELKHNNTLVRNKISYRILKKDNDYEIHKRESGTDWYILYQFNLHKYNEKDFEPLIEKYYNDIFYGPFWKSVRFAYYPDKKLRAIKGTTVYYENNQGDIIIHKHSTIDDFKNTLNQYFSPELRHSFQFVKAFEKLNEINIYERFGLTITEKELQLFLNKIDITKPEISLDFINKFIVKVLNKIPFQNYMMIERGFGHIPVEKDIKEDMLSLNGGTCATMNTFLGAVLYKLGFNVCLINGTMMKPNDHISILLRYNEQFYVMDMGDGQPYFEAFPIKNKIYKHPFRTYRTVVENNNIRIDFWIKEKWSTDCTLHLVPKTYKQVYKTLENHYTHKEFGPFWKGVRFAIYPNKEIIALRDKTLTLQKGNVIEKKSIKDRTHLSEILSKYLPDFKTQIINCYIKTKLL